jgi:hypothetical protein
MERRFMGNHGRGGGGSTEMTGSAPLKLKNGELTRPGFDGEDGGFDARWSARNARTRSRSLGRRGTVIDARMSSIRSATIIVSNAWMHAARRTRSA